MNLVFNAGSNLKSVRKDNSYFRKIKERDKIDAHFFEKNESD